MCLQRETFNTGREKGSERREREREGRIDGRMYKGLIHPTVRGWGGGNTERLLVSVVHYKYKLVQSSNQSHLHWPPTRIPVDAQSE